MTVTSIASDNQRARQLRHLLAGQLTAEGRIRAPEWRKAFEATPRHFFVPRFFQQDGDWHLIDGTNPAQYDQWLSAVYSDETLIIQLVDEPIPAELGGGTRKMFTSSSTAPGLMMRMLEELDVQDGHHVLEVGTGSGYNAALLSARLNSENVTSVDISPDLTKQARARLTTAGHTPHLVTNDGWLGAPENAPYHRIIATCAVSAIPPAWIEQTITGGMILTDLRGQIAGTLVKLYKDSDHTATGRFLSEWAGFMYLRHDPMPLSLGGWAGQEWCGWSGVAGWPVGGAFDAVGVVSGAFDGAGAGAVAAWRVGSVSDFVDGVGQRVCKVLRG